MGDSVGSEVVGEEAGAGVRAGVGIIVWLRVGPGVGLRVGSGVILRVGTEVR